MIPRLNIRFPIKRQWQYWFGKQYEPRQGEYLLNHARSGIVIALRVSLPNGGRVGVVAYNCHTVANAVVHAGCKPVFVDVTEDLRIDIDSLPVNLDAIIVTNLFGIRNDIAVIRKRLPKAVIIVDNAHGYGLPEEGDFTVYSINQGKFPSLGEGGILLVNDEILMANEVYSNLPSYGFIAQVKLFVQMQMKALAYNRCIYWLTIRMKKTSNPKVNKTIVMRKMAPGIRRLFKAWLPYAREEIARQKRNATKITDCIIGDNGFMAVLKCDYPTVLQMRYAGYGVETATHFKNAIVWAEQFGYVRGSCPKAEELTEHLLMIPTYRAL